MLIWTAQLCLSSLTAISQKNYYETFQEHYWNKLKNSVNSVFTEFMSTCLWKNNVLYLKNMLHAAALPQTYRDSRVKVQAALGLALLVSVASLLIHVCPLETHRSHKTLRIIQAWWRVRLKTASRTFVVKCKTLIWMFTLPMNVDACGTNTTAFMQHRWY